MVSIEEALTFDDVTLAPKYSEILPTEVDTTVTFPNIMSNPIAQTQSH